MLYIIRMRFNKKFEGMLEALRITLQMITNLHVIFVTYVNYQKKRKCVLYTWSLDTKMSRDQTSR